MTETELDVNADEAWQPEYYHNNNNNNKKTNLNNFTLMLMLLDFDSSWLQLETLFCACNRAERKERKV